MSDLYSIPSGTVDATLTGAPTGLAGTLGVQILNADDGTVVTVRVTAGIIEAPAGSGTYLKTLTAPSAPGDYLIFWDIGVVSPSSTAVDRLTVNFTGAAPAAPSPTLITLDEFRAIQGIDPTYTVDDIRYLALLGPVSDAIRSYTERDFGLPVVTEQRTYEYDGSGFLDIDDASDVTDVTLAYPYGAPDITLSGDEWRPMPARRADSQIYTYISMPGYVGHVPGMDPEMGFTWNLDVYARERGRWALPSNVKVTGTWGWLSIPSDVKMAAAWVLQSWVTRPTSDGLSSEAIEGWSRSWGSRSGSSAAALAIPEPVHDLLARYSKIEV